MYQLHGDYDLPCRSFVTAHSRLQRLEGPLGLFPHVLAQGRQGKGVSCSCRDVIEAGDGDVAGNSQTESPLLHQESPGPVPEGSHPCVPLGSRDRQPSA